MDRIGQIGHISQNQNKIDQTESDRIREIKKILQIVQNLTDHTELGGEIN